MNAGLDDSQIKCAQMLLNRAHKQIISRYNMYSNANQELRSEAQGVTFIIVH